MFSIFLNVERNYGKLPIVLIVKTRLMDKPVKGDFLQRKLQYFLLLGTIRKQNVVHDMINWKDFIQLAS